MIRAALTLEPGQVYTDKHGQKREAVKVMSHLILYRLVRHGRGGIRIPINPGETRWTSLANFREWVYGRKRCK